MLGDSDKWKGLQFSGNTPALNRHLDIVYVFYVKPYPGPVTLSLQPSP
jgi:hypothetical protein